MPEDTVLKKRLVVGGFSLAAALAAGYYLASPFLALNGLKNSFENKDADKVNQ